MDWVHFVPWKLALLAGVIVTIGGLIIDGRGYRRGCEDSDKLYRKREADRLRRDSVRHLDSRSARGAVQSLIRETEGRY